MNLPPPANVTRADARLCSGLFDELVVDNFAGGGGASMGIEAAIGRAVDVAINHDKAAVDTHRINHPHTHHLCEDVWDVDPLEATAGKPVGLAWFSPDCKHFSRAKGGKPVEKKIRGLAWVAVRWAKLVRPRIIILENVREFQEWGPLTADNKPCPKRKGVTFKRFVGRLRNLGYAVEFRELNAADYGAPTHRRRLFLIARCDGLPITWPEPSHGPGRRSYRTAAECIDWTTPCPSIFLTKEQARRVGVNRPLAEKTMRRIAMGLKRFVLDNPKPFIVTCNHGGAEFRGQSVEEPLKTITGSRDAHGVVTPFMVEVQNASSQTGVRAVDRPAHTVTANPKGGGMALASPYVVRNFHGEKPADPMEEPLRTVTTQDNKFSVVAPFLAHRYGEAPHQQTRGQKADEPIRTITPNANCGTLIAPHLVKFRGDSAGSSAAEPMPTITSGAGAARPAGAAHALGVMAANLIQYNGEKGGETRGSDIREPVNTIPTENRFGLVGAFLAKHYGGVVGHEPERPLGTITAIDHHSVVASHLSHFNHGEKQWADPRDPLRTITAEGNHIAEVRAFLIRYYSSGGQVSAADAPAPTITAVDRLGLVKVQGEEYQIADIGMRMLEPRELLRAQFGKYAKGYVLTGPKWMQVKMIGNSVCPQLAEVLVRANYSVGKGVAVA